jgi:hypothetical protein
MKWIYLVMFFAGVVLIHSAFLYCIFSLFQMAIHGEL